MPDTIRDETLRKILADEVLIVSPDDIAMAKAIRDGSADETNNFVRIAMSAMRFSYEFGKREERRVTHCQHMGRRHHSGGWTCDHCGQ